ncbi:MAG: cysteine hydrolase family protein [Actinomycetota bacterium]
MIDWQGSTALIVIDVQQGFDDAEFWGRRNNPSCEDNIVRLVDAWREKGWPIVFVRHNSAKPTSPLAQGSSGNALKSMIAGDPDLLVTKQVHSAFYGEPDLKAWLDSHGITGVAITGIQTNMCCETTARMASDLGYRLQFVEDATHTFDVTDSAGTVFRAEDIARYTALTIAADFGRVVTTSQIIDN